MWKQKFKDHSPSPTSPAPSKRKLDVHSPSKRVSKRHQPMEEESNSNFKFDDEFIQLAKVAKCYLLGGPPGKVVSIEKLDTVDSSCYNEYGWGKECFEMTIESLKAKNRQCEQHHLQSAFKSCINNDDVVGDGENEDDEKIDYEEDDEPGDDDVKDDDDDDDDDEDGGGGDDCGQSVSVVEKVKIDEVHVAVDGGSKLNEDVVDASTAQECTKIDDKLVVASGIFADLKENLFSKDDDDFIDVGASMACGVQAVEKMIFYLSILMESSSTPVVAGQTSVSFGFHGLVQNDVRDIVVFEETPILIPEKRDKKKGAMLKSPFIELGSSGAKLDYVSNSPDDSDIKIVKYVRGSCPLDDKIGEPVEPTLEIAFDVWLGQSLRSKKLSKTANNVYLKGKYKISPPFWFGVEEVDNKT
uniref:Uncharacterized protein n=1 Tax=Cannabis sativa TaxID=3483 RepID=A0A803NSG5_CANSA